MATPAQRAAARANGQLGGRPTSMLTELKRKAREKATKLVLAQQEESIKFLVYVRDNPNAALNERVRCALELLNRGEMPAKSASFHGIGSASEVEEMFSTPKLVVLGQFERKTSENEHGSEAEVVGDEARDGHAPE